MDAQNVLEFRHISKQFPGVLALDDVSLCFRKGEVHAIVGENGAGKSTLIKTCTGAIAPTAGSVVVNGCEYAAFTPAVSRENGIAVIYQEFNLVSQLSVSENVFLGRPLKKRMLVDQQAMDKATAELLDRLMIDIKPQTLVKDLSTGYQQLVEIAKALSHNTQILIMDEPTASLTTSEVDTIFRIIHQLREAGVTIVYISHRLDEIFEIADRVSVLRDGKLIDTRDTADTDRNQLISLMVGRTLTETFPDIQSPEAAQTILEVEHLSGIGVKDVSFTLNRSEILGLGGLIGAGRTETAMILYGAAPAFGGEIRYMGRKITPRTPGEAVGMGISLAPEDRKSQGVLLHMSVGQNISLPSLKRISKGTVIDGKKEKQLIDRYNAALHIKTPSLAQLVKNLSGGNQQKVVLAKWLATQPDVIILDEPTRGIDVGAKQEIYGIMRELIAAGKTIIMISSDMEELLGMSSRIVVFCEGRVSGELQKADFTQEAVLTLASAVQN